MKKPVFSKKYFLVSSLLVNVSGIFICFLGHSDDSESKTADLTKAVEELQGLLKESSERYGELERTYDAEKLDHKEEIKTRNEALRAIKKELDSANDLIKTLQNKGLSMGAIEQLSPSAAAASKLLKSGNEEL